MALTTKPKPPKGTVISFRLLDNEVQDLDAMTDKLGGDRTGTIRLALSRLKEYLDSGTKKGGT